jgi:predicted AlkP superfamily pyrophosphatase or phosphodiesterase
MMLFNKSATVSRRGASSKSFVLATCAGWRACLLALAAFGISVLSSPVQAEGVPIFSSNKIVVMISVDGLAGFYLDDPKAEMPTIRALAAEGARAESMKPVAPTVTWPNHTTLVTGVYPIKHGVLGNNYFDRATGHRVTLISDPVYDKVQIVKVPTIYDLAKAAGLKTTAILWPASRNAPTLDWTTPDVVLPELVEKCTTPALLEECKQAGIDFMGEMKGAKREPLDAQNTQVFNLILRLHHPDLGLLHLIGVDHTQHLYGPRSAEAYAAIKAADDCVREVWETLKREFPERATVFLVSDHGFSPISQIILPNVVLKKAGLQGSGKSNKNAAVETVSQGGCSMVYIREQPAKAATVAKIKKAFSKVKGVSKIVGSKHFKDYGLANPSQDPRAPDMLLFAEEGKAFGDTAAGDLPFELKPERKGSHGHDPEVPDLQATFVAWGVGIKPKVRLGKIPNIDVAPTIAKLIGVTLPNPDGHALSALLTKSE